MTEKLNLGKAVLVFYRLSKNEELSCVRNHGIGGYGGELLLAGFHDRAEVHSGDKGLILISQMAMHANSSLRGYLFSYQIHGGKALFLFIRQPKADSLTDGQTHEIFFKDLCFGM